MIPAARRRTRDEQGVMLVVFALLLVAIVGMVALVLDLSIVRSDRKTNKRAADVAAAAGLQAMAHPDGKPRHWAGVCQAYDFLKANQSEVSTFGTETWKDGNGSTTLLDASGVGVIGSPCEGSPEYSPALKHLTNVACDPASPDEHARFEGVSAGGRITVRIESPYALPDEFETAAAGDSGEACKQIGVIVRETQPRGFSAVFAGDDLRSTIRSVGRIIIDDVGDAVAALILLERHDCLALNIEGNSGAKAEVMGLPDVPGIIHADALGDGSDCSGLNDSENVMNLTVGSRDPSKGEGPLIVAHQATDGTPGIIQLRALNLTEGGVPGNASDPTPLFVNAEGEPGPPAGSPRSGPLVGRRRVDRRFLAPLTDLRNEATGAFADPSSVLGATFATYGCALPATVAETRVHVDCADLALTSSVAFTGDRARIVFGGRVAVSGSGTVLSFTNPDRVFVAGSETATALDLSGPTALNVNLDGGTGCLNRANYTDENDPERLETTKLVVGKGQFVTSGQAALRLCQTTVYMADSSGVVPCPLPATADANAAPYSNNCRGRISIAGQGDVDWSAPNRTSLPPEADDVAELEDLAFWTETSAVPGNNCGPTNDLNCVQGNGLLRLKGIFVLPNADPFRIAGNGSQNITADAQFWTRKLTVAGRGVLRMAPNPNDSVAIPVIKGFVLVR